MCRFLEQYLLFTTTGRDGDRFFIICAQTQTIASRGAICDTVGRYKLGAMSAYKRVELYGTISPPAQKRNRSKIWRMSLRYLFRIGLGHGRMQLEVKQVLRSLGILGGMVAEFYKIRYYECGIIMSQSRERVFCYLLPPVGRPFFVIVSVSFPLLNNIISWWLYRQNLGNRAQLQQYHEITHS